MDDGRLSLQIKTDFNFCKETGSIDPDMYSSTLQCYHKQLWSKPLPNGTLFKLEFGTTGKQLIHTSDLGEFVLTSDAISHSYLGERWNDFGYLKHKLPPWRWKRMKHITDEISDDEMKEFIELACTIGSFIIFPKGTREEQGINSARGFDKGVEDRFDITLDYIRRYYNNENRPLKDTRLKDALERNSPFFELFGSFRGYIEFFLLQDLVTEDFSKIRFHLPYDYDDPNPLPRSADEYRVYMNNTIAFIKKRNDRIKKWCGENSNTLYSRQK
jgi:hypothetical protein